MAYTYRVDHVPVRAAIRPGERMTPTTITIHNTDNPTSVASGERRWLTNPENKRTASWHLCVDNKEVVEAVPLNEVAWHAGSTKGNYSSIGIEICESGDYNLTLRNAADLVASLLRKYGWGIDRIRKHNDWSGKICPHLMYNNGTWSGYNQFKKMVQDRLNGGGGGEIAETGNGGSTGGSTGGAKPLDKPSNARIGTVTITADTLNVRNQPGVSGGIVRSIPNGEVWNTYAVQNGWYRLHDGWVSGDYVKFSAVGGSIGGGGGTAAHGVVRVTATSLNVRKGPGANHEYVKSIPQGSEWEFFAIQNGWYNLGGDQWVSGEYVTVVSGGGGSSSVAGNGNRIGVITVTATSLNVRTGPGTGYGVVRSIPNGDAWNVYAKQNGWYKVHDGWVSGDYVTFRPV